MTPAQRAAALRLADALTYWPSAFSPTDLMLETAALLRELAVEPQGKPVAWWIPRAEQFALAKKDGSRPFAKAWEPLYAAPQQQRKPLSQDDVRAFAKFAGLDWQRGYVVDDIHNRYEDFARAIEKAHGTGEEA